MVTERFTLIAYTLANPRNPRRTRVCRVPQHSINGFYNQLGYIEENKNILALKEGWQLKWGKWGKLGNLPPNTKQNKNK